MFSDNTNMSNNEVSNDEVFSDDSDYERDGFVVSDDEVEYDSSTSYEEENYSSSSDEEEGLSEEEHSASPKATRKDTRKDPPSPPPQRTYVRRIPFQRGKKILQDKEFMTVETFQILRIPKNPRKQASYKLAIYEGLVSQIGYQGSLIVPLINDVKDPTNFFFLRETGLKKKNQKCNACNRKRWLVHSIMIQTKEEIHRYFVGCECLKALKNVQHAAEEYRRDLEK